MARPLRNVVENDEEQVVGLQATSSRRTNTKYRRGHTQDVDDRNGHGHGHGRGGTDLTQTIDVDDDQESSQQQQQQQQQRHKRRRGQEEDEVPPTQMTDSAADDLWIQLTQNVPDDEDPDQSQDDNDEEKWLEWERIAEQGGHLDPDSVAIALDEQATAWGRTRDAISKASRTIGDAAAFTEEQARLAGLEQSSVYPVLEEYARVLSDDIRKSHLRVRILRRLRDLASQQPDDNLAQTFKSTAEAQDAQYDALSQRQKYGTDEAELYIYFRTLAWDAGHSENEPMPALKELLPTGEGDADDSDDDLQMGGVVVSFKCPLTQDYLEAPQRSKQCTHVFSKRSIAEHVRRGSARCPVAGCSATVSKDDLEDDYLMEKRTKLHLRRLKSAPAGALAEVID